MKPEVLKAIKEAAEALAHETEDRQDAMQYLDQLVDDTNADFKLGYEKSSDSYGVLYKACHSAVWEATKGR